jgi:serine O-acetyltransferase
MDKSELGEFERVTREILADNGKAEDGDHLKFVQLPNREKVEDMVDKLFQIVYPGYFRDRSIKFYNIRHFMTTLLEDVAYHIHQQVAIALRYRSDCMNDPEALEKRAKYVTMEFLHMIPQVKKLLDLDIEAFYEGDPAAENTDEIIFCYPGLRAVTVYRFAHILCKLGVPVLPRIMTEYAHAQTGIDIHPGAKIGRYFFIDHGTGIVIGETTVIGDHVKIYQGVTLGGLSTRGGQSLRGKKRHPTIEDNVTIYSGASILGGRTIIGHDCVIGGNAFITKPVAPYTKVSVQNQELVYNHDKGKLEQVDSQKEAAWFYVI